VKLTETREMLPFQVAGPVAAAIARFCFPAGFLIVDSAVLIGTATVSHWFPGNAEDPVWQGFLPGTDAAYPLVFWGVTLVTLGLFGFYDRLRMLLRNSELTDLYAALTLSVVVTMAVLIVLNRAAVASVYIITWVITPPAMALARNGLRRMRRRVFPASTLTVPVLLIGKTDDSERLLRRINAAPELDFMPIRAAETALDDIDTLRRFVLDNRLRHIIIMPSQDHPAFVIEMAAFCQEHGLRVAWLQHCAGLPMTISSVHTWDGTPVIQLSEPVCQRLYETGKRILDFAAGLLILPFLMPLLGLCILAVRLDSPGGALMKQRRVGRGGRIFNMYKFRTMRTVGEDVPENLRQLNEATGPMFKIQEDPRITRVGRILRRASLDELPQILNVLRGEMSFVGPRPPLPREIPGYDEMQRRRLMVKPGITGLWQVSGRSNLTFDEMLYLDVCYIQKRSLLLDVIIMFKTVPCVLSGRGAY
jgi:exopolysaccharide biosynthesis polyprenyl glycosylphosphotransferase